MRVFLNGCLLAGLWLLVFVSDSAWAGSSGGISRRHVPTPAKPAVENKEERSILEAPIKRRQLSQPPAEPAEGPVPMLEAREFSPSLSKSELHIARILLELYNLEEDQQLSVDRIEAEARKLARNPADAAQILEKLYETVAEDEKEKCNSEYLNLLMARRFMPLKDIPEKNFEREKGFSLEEFRFFEDALSKATGKREAKAKQESQFQSPFQAK